MTRLTRRHAMAGLLCAAAACHPRAGHWQTTAQSVFDWPWIGRYAADNQALLDSGITVDTVFMGDSITENWPRLSPAFFPAGRICRGISGQNTTQMTLRMMTDVIALKPAAVHLMGGINDIAGNGGPVTDKEILANLTAMIVMAKSAGIRVWLGSILPASRVFWKPELDPRERIVSLNTRLAEIAAALEAEWIDYHASMKDESNGMKAPYADDGLHPNAIGYQRMQTILAPTIRPI